MIYVADSMEEARRDFADPVIWYYRTIGRYVSPPAGQEAIESYETYTAPRDLALNVEFDDLVAGGGVIAGDPDYCCREIERLEEEFGFTDLLCWTRMGGMDASKVMRSMELMDKHVIPHFKGKVGAGVAEERVRSPGLPTAHAVFDAEQDAPASSELGRCACDMLCGHVDVAEGSLEPVLGVDGVRSGRLEAEIHCAYRLVNRVGDGQLQVRFVLRDVCAALRRVPARRRGVEKRGTCCAYDRCRLADCLLHGAAVAEE